MTDKALEAALMAYWEADPGPTDTSYRDAMQAAISAYLSALPGEAEVAGLVGKLRYLVSLDDPKNGGPFGGFAAQECMRAMSSAADALQAMQARAEAAEAELAESDCGSDHADDILAARAKFQCHECVEEEREFSCHDLADVVIVDGKVVCKECVAEFYPKARVKKAPDIGKKLRRQRMFARQQQTRAEAAETRVKELEEALERAEAEASKGLDEGETREALIDIKFTARTALKGGSNG